MFKHLLSLYRMILIMNLDTIKLNGQTMLKTGQFMHLILFP